MSLAEDLIKAVIEGKDAKELVDLCSDSENFEEVDEEDVDEAKKKGKGHYEVPGGKSKFLIPKGVKATTTAEYPTKEKVAQAIAAKAGIDKHGQAKMTKMQKAGRK